MNTLKLPKWLYTIFGVMPRSSSENKEAKRIKSMFMIYFDGCYMIDPVEDTSNTFAMGICKLEYKNNELTVHLRRPGLLIGKGGRIIDALSEHLECKIKIVEVNLNEA